ncbi:hypothetical protein IF655_05665 [Streptomyces sp. DSM 110735]|uniref:DUF6415 family natural product biosynthesis protein n=1 Tax=Streptomyces sp. DSM 110735 TaxID=2775031 RepID=UPI0018F58DB4|nr:DUF6415 family natural product biosynthesis protein [Streptomyces sp. DSM 110735]MBJ7902782.1 hypothetical protein [Streptomyces sp. DSM 110735]
MNGTTTRRPFITGITRAGASLFLDQRTLPRYGVVQSFEADFRAALAELMPRLEELAAERPDDDTAAEAVRVALAEARDRLSEQEAPGLQGEFVRVKRLATSVVHMCEHLDGAQQPGHVPAV